METPLVRQVWIFLDQQDEQDLVQTLSAQTPLGVLHGRFFRGTEDDLRNDPGSLETSSIRPSEHTLHLIHPTASGKLVVDHLEDGPFAGWSRLDDVRSEVITLVRPEAGQQGLAPGRIEASTHAWLGGTKLRKSPEFTRWTASVMKTVEETYPLTGYDWIRLGPSTLAWAESGGRLHYLFRDVPPRASGPRVTRSHGSARR